MFLGTEFEQTRISHVTFFLIIGTNRKDEAGIEYQEGDYFEPQIRPIAIGITRRAIYYRHRG